MEMQETGMMPTHSSHLYNKSFFSCHWKEVAFADFFIWWSSEGTPPYRYKNYWMQSSSPPSPRINKTVLVWWFLTWSCPLQWRTAEKWINRNVLTFTEDQAAKAQALRYPAKLGETKELVTAQQQEGAEFQALLLIIIL